MFETLYENSMLPTPQKNSNIMSIPEEKLKLVIGQKIVEVNPVFDGNWLEIILENDCTIQIKNNADEELPLIVEVI